MRDEQERAPPPSLPLTASLGGERRRHKRHPVDGDVALTGPTRATGIALNISDCGIRIMVNRQIQPGARCTVELRRGDFKLVYFDLRAVWSRRFEGGCVVGLEL